VLDLVLVAAIAKATPQTPHKVDPPLHFAQQQRPTVARYLTSRKACLNTA
jgi:hypothetical protein